MNTPDLRQESPWNAELMLPRVTDNPQLLELQILLGGLQLVLSRVHPAFAATRFAATRQLASGLTRGIETLNPQQARMVRADLQRALTETEKALDPGSLMVLHKLLAQAMAGEHDEADIGPVNFTFSDFMAKEQMSVHYQVAH
ncbi:MAG: hypothetical protein H7172_04595 [Ferruginibacter sp.]|nr:hypothetical protein [Rhodoferax sp.]